MTRTLDVYLHRDLVGQLTQDAHGLHSFAYAAEWLANPTAVPVSQSLPLRVEPFAQRDCVGFFGGLLPDADQREQLAHNLQVSAKNEYALLAEIGGECAGAVTFVPAGETYPDARYDYKPLNDAALAAVLRGLPQRPMLAGEDGIRMSLAGAQAKIAVCVHQDGVIAIPLGGAPSTHILKPANAHYPGVVFNEVLCMQLAAAVDLPVAKAEAHTVDGLDYLLVERYDRQYISMGIVTDAMPQLHPWRPSLCKRLHQEDFCQALGIAPDRKYQKDGGPSLKMCFDLVRRVSTQRVGDLQRLLNAVIFNLLIGNTDAHGKNFSLLYSHAPLLGRDVPQQAWNVTMAPLYDLLSTTFYKNLSQHMAMSIGRETRADSIGRAQFEAFAEEVGLNKTQTLRRAEEITQRVVNALRQIPVEHETQRAVVALIRERCERLSPLFRS